MDVVTSAGCQRSTSTAPAPPQASVLAERPDYLTPAIRQRSANTALPELQSSATADPVALVGVSLYGPGCSAAFHFRRSPGQCS